MTPALHAKGLSKTFTLHVQGGTQIPVFKDVELKANPGQCICLHGPSGSGKSTLLRSLYANYLPDNGQILVWHRDKFVDILSADPWDVIDIRRDTIGYVSQFLRVIPRVSTLDIVCEPAIKMGQSVQAAQEKARELLTRLRVPSNLWSLAPATFSGGEQQRVNIARSFIVDYPVLLLDEPTASLDQHNSQTVIELIREKKVRKSAIVGIFHDAAVREAVADSYFEFGQSQPS